MRAVEFCKINGYVDVSLEYSKVWGFLVLPQFICQTFYTFEYLLYNVMQQMQYKTFVMLSKQCAVVLLQKHKLRHVSGCLC